MAIPAQLARVAKAARLTDDDVREIIAEAGDDLQGAVERILAVEAQHGTLVAAARAKFIIDNPLVIPPEFADTFHNREDPNKRSGVPHLVDYLIPESLRSLTHARFGNNKTMLALCAGVHIVLGKPDFLGLPINRHGPFLFIDAEDRAQANQDRIIKIARGLGFVGWPSDFVYRNCRVGDLMKPAFIAEIAELVRKVGVIGTVVDSFIQGSGLEHYGSGNDSKIVQFYDGLRKLKTVWVLDHDTDGKAGVMVADPRPAGSSVKRTIPESVFGLREVDGGFELRQGKGVNGVLPPFKFTVDFSPTQIVMRRVGAYTAPVYSGAKAAVEHWVMTAVRIRGGKASVAEIVADTGRDRSTVYRNVKELIKDGILIKDGQMVASA
jgi:AAA domain